MTATALSPRALPAAPAWQLWGALSIVYVVWGSTYLAIRVMVETVPPLLGAGVRFAVAGAVLLAVVRSRVRVARVEAGAAAGTSVLMLFAAFALLYVGEQRVP